jgi:hypothetical protein
MTFLSSINHGLSSGFRKVNWAELRGLSRLFSEIAEADFSATLSSFNRSLQTNFLNPPDCLQSFDFPIRDVTPGADIAMV